VSNELDLDFKTTAQVESFSRWYLRTSVSQVQDEFKSDEDRAEFLTLRDWRLRSELAQLFRFSLEKPVIHSIDQKFYHIGLQASTDPINDSNSHKKNSRFNYKEADIFRNSVAYLGVNRRTCYVEKFHLAIQRKNYALLMNRTPEQMEDELPQPSFKLWEFHVKLKNILVLTSEATLKAVGLSTDVVRNEWYPTNDVLGIPTAGQILAAKAKRQGFSGILYTSVRYQTKNNLVIFQENTGKLDFVETNTREYDPNEERDEDEA
jgi:hypothetical protein